MKNKKLFVSIVALICMMSLFLTACSVNLPFGKKAVGEAIGMAECAVLAVCDTGFALALCQKLGKTELAAELELKLQREKRRKQKKLAGKPTGNKSSEKRGKRV